jgi:hypothetical protein
VIDTQSTYWFWFSYLQSFQSPNTQEVYDIMGKTIIHTGDGKMEKKETQESDTYLSRSLC